MNSSLVNNTRNPPFEAYCSLPLFHGIALITANSTVCVFGTLGNLMVCLAVVTNPRLRRSSNYLLFSLAIADLIVTMVCEPLLLEIFSKRTFFYNCTTKHFEFPYAVLSGISCAASVMHLAAISVDRLMAVCFPLRHRCFIDKCVLPTMLVISWVYPVSLPVLRIILGKSFPLARLIKLNFGLCVLIITLSYLIILVFVFFQKRKRNKLSGRLSSAYIRSRREVRVACTLAIVIGVFAVCWVPIMVSFYMTGKPLIKFYGPTHMWLRTLSLSNSAMNFWIYTAKIPDFRNAYAKIYRKMCRQ